MSRRLFTVAAIAALACQAVLGQGFSASVLGTVTDNTGGLVPKATVTVTNRGQNGYRDDVVRQQVVCGSQYYDGYQTRTAPTC